ncbi:protein TRIGALACTOSYLDIACYLGLYCEROL 4, chloroplastic-like [Amaranthus tricolor]|uniref:protein TRIGALACTOSYLDIACYLGLYCEROL 4, chloroplastic-like n=1 Tax=Amaranthus tricolor TaxID=29722 RepID=UPI00258ED2A7|nr:protein TRIGALACTOSYLDIACYLGLYCEROL 4, chloroplastic-like [Amaranthus tricolor]
MAKLRTAMDAAFWDMDISSTQNLDGCAKAIPGDPLPLDSCITGKVLRVQQLSLLGNGFPLGIIPSLTPSLSKKDVGSFTLQSLLLRPSFGLVDFDGTLRCELVVSLLVLAAKLMDFVAFDKLGWLGLAGQIRPKKLISNLKEDVYKLINGDEFERPSFKDVADHVMDKSLYALALCTQIPISSSTSLLLSSEVHGERKGRRNKVLLFHKFCDLVLKVF